MKLKMLSRALTALCLSTILFSACTKSASDNVAPTSASTTSASASAAAASTTTNSVATNLDNTLMLKLVNDLRAKGCTCGTTAMPAVSALTWNDQLSAAALVHSKDMAATGLFSHNSSDGSTFDTRITAAGYKWMAVGENIAFGQTSEQEVFNAWLNSEGHCKNMMGASFKEMGAARVNNYWTQDFGAK